LAKLAIYLLHRTVLEVNTETGKYRGDDRNARPDRKWGGVRGARSAPFLLHRKERRSRETTAGSWRGGEAQETIVRR